MAHRVSRQAEDDLDDIWLYVAKQSGSMDIASRLVDSITSRFASGHPRQPRSGAVVRAGNVAKRFDIRYATHYTSV